MDPTGTPDLNAPQNKKAIFRPAPALVPVKTAQS
jgi:hypothetical protein